MTRIRRSAQLMKNVRRTERLFRSNTRVRKQDFERHQQDINHSHRRDVAHRMSLEVSFECHLILIESHLISVHLSVSSHLLRSLHSPDSFSFAHSKFVSNAISSQSNLISPQFIYLSHLIYFAHFIHSIHSVSLTSFILFISSHFATFTITYISHHHIMTSSRISFTFFHFFYLHLSNSSSSITSFMRTL
jgi:hypothetical protein